MAVQFAVKRDVSEIKSRRTKRDTSKKKPGGGGGGGKKCLIMTFDKKIKVELPYGPLDASVSNIGHNWEETPRPYRRTLLIRGQAKLPQWEFTVFMGYKNINKPVELKLKRLRKLANTGKTIIVKYGPHEMTMGPWRITDLSYQVVNRRPRDSKITRVQLSMTFQKANDLKLNLGPVSGGKKDDDGKGKGKKDGKGNGKGK